FGNRLEKARPARTGFVFGFRGEKRRSTTYAMIDAVAFFHIVGVRKGAFGAVLAGHMILFGRKFFAPFTGGALLCVAHLGPSLVVSVRTLVGLRLCGDHNFKGQRRVPASVSVELAERGVTVCKLILAGPAIRDLERGRRQGSGGRLGPGLDVIV